VNDPFVLKFWADSKKVDGKITLLGDGNGEFVKAAGLTLDGSGVGLGSRGQRFAFAANDGKIEYLAVEEGKNFDVSSAESVLAKL